MVRIGFRRHFLTNDIRHYQMDGLQGDPEFQNGLCRSLQQHLEDPLLGGTGKGFRS